MRIEDAALAVTAKTLLDSAGRLQNSYYTLQFDHHYNMSHNIPRLDITCAIAVEDSIFGSRFPKLLLTIQFSKLCVRFLPYIDILPLAKSKFIGVVPEYKELNLFADNKFYYEDPKFVILILEHTRILLACHDKVLAYDHHC